MKSPLQDNFATRSAAMVFAAMLPMLLAAQPTREDVFKSISENVAHDNSSSAALLPVVFIIAGALLLVVLFNLRSTQKSTPKPVNHQGRLLKEIKAKVGLRNAEIKQLKLLADLPTEEGKLAEHALVLVLCPSVLNKAMQRKPPRVDRRIILGLARKMGLTGKR